MDLMKGKKGVIFGVSNTHGIAYGIAKQLHDAGAEIAFTYAGEAMEKRVRPIAEDMGAKIIMSCDVTKEEEVKAVFEECEKVYGKLDFVVHAVAFAKNNSERKKYRVAPDRFKLPVCIFWNYAWKISMASFFFRCSLWNSAFFCFWKSVKAV